MYNIYMYMHFLQAGGFYSAEDADSYPTSDSVEKKEGAFCVWTAEEVHSVLSNTLPDLDGKTMADVFCHRYDVRRNGNVDPYQVANYFVMKVC